ncbi:hypothetical protein [Streptomyces viridochromogenes]|uniref:hypothetical protein n=1 Tax=Streptomyces viridochromogenes TaxID=1938 RepID=UPI000A711598|nr:hypothetical protein [Streptomyces viridochromogenes]
MIPAITDETVHRLVEQAEADRIDRPKNSAAASRRSKCDPDHLLTHARAEDDREVAVVK